jgi:Cell division protein SepF
MSESGRPGSGDRPSDGPDGGDLDLTWMIREFREVLGDPAYYIASGRTVTVRVEAEPAVVRRVVDFLSGLVYARDGTLERIDRTVFRASAGGSVSRPGGDGSG